MTHLDYDLHDIHDVQSRSLVYLHSLVEALRTAGVRVQTFPELNETKFGTFSFLSDPYII